MDLNQRLILSKLNIIFHRARAFPPKKLFWDLEGKPLDHRKLDFQLNISCCTYLNNRLIFDHLFIHLKECRIN